MTSFPLSSQAHVYDVIEDEELEKQQALKREAPTTDDGLYNLLQAVNWNKQCAVSFTLKNMLFKMFFYRRMLQTLISVSESNNGYKNGEKVQSKSKR